MKEQLNDINHTLASNGQRVIAVAQISNYQGGLSESELTESLDNLEIQGFVGIIDPPRTDVKEAVKVAQEAGIRVKMITGDHPQTASMIAQEIGLIDFDKTMTGKRSTPWQVKKRLMNGSKKSLYLLGFRRKINFN